MVFQSRHVIYCITCTKCKKQFVAAVSDLQHISSIKYDLARSCFQFWLKIGDEGDKISRKKLARR